MSDSPVSYTDSVGSTPAPSQAPSADDYLRLLQFTNITPRTAATQHQERIQRAKQQPRPLHWDDPTLKFLFEHDESGTTATTTDAHASDARHMRVPAAGRTLPGAHTDTDSDMAGERVDESLDVVDAAYDSSSGGFGGEGIGFNTRRTVDDILREYRASKRKQGHSRAQQRKDEPRGNSYMRGADEEAEDEEKKAQRIQARVSERAERESDEESGAPERVQHHRRRHKQRSPRGASTLHTRRGHDDDDDDDDDDDGDDSDSRGRRSAGAIESEDDEGQLERDAGLSHLETAMSNVCKSMKSHLFSEYGRARGELLLSFERTLEKERDQHRRQMRSLNKELEGLRDLVSTYESHLQHKDQIIANTTAAVTAQREKANKQRSLSQWHVRTVEARREAFASKLAGKHARRMALIKAFRGWRSVIENKWRQRIEKACKLRAEQICHDMSAEYEEKLREVRAQLLGAQQQIERFRIMRAEQEERMKKAFMRGVCALNMEAMEVFDNPALQSLSPQEQQQQQQQQQLGHSLSAPAVTLRGPQQQTHMRPQQSWPRAVPQPQPQQRAVGVGSSADTDLPRVQRPPVPTSEPARPDAGPLYGDAHIRWSPNSEADGQQQQQQQQRQQQHRGKHVHAARARGEREDVSIATRGTPLVSTRHGNTGVKLVS